MKESVKRIVDVLLWFCCYVFVQQRRPKDDSAAEKTAIMVHDNTGSWFMVKG